MDLSITQAQTSEAQNLIDLMYSCKEDLEQDGLLEFSKESKEKQLERIESHTKTNSVYIIKSDNKIIATLSIIKLNPLIFDEEEDYENYFNNSSFSYIGALLVAKEHRKKGLAKMLVDHIEKVQGKDTVPPEMFQEVFFNKKPEKNELLNTLSLGLLK